MYVCVCGTEGVKTIKNNTNGFSFYVSFPCVSCRLPCHASFSFRQQQCVSAAPRPLVFTARGEWLLAFILLLYHINSQVTRSDVVGFVNIIPL